MLIKTLMKTSMPRPSCRDHLSENERSAVCRRGSFRSDTLHSSAATYEMFDQVFPRVRRLVAGVTSLSVSLSSITESRQMQRTTWLQSLKTFSRSPAGCRDHYIDYKYWHVSIMWTGQSWWRDGRSCFWHIGNRQTDGWMDDDSTRLVNVPITCPGETGGGG